MKLESILVRIDMSLMETEYCTHKQKKKKVMSTILLWIWFKYGILLWYEYVSDVLLLRLHLKIRFAIAFEKVSVVLSFCYFATYNALSIITMLGF